MKIRKSLFKVSNANYRATYCEPCSECIFQAFFSLFQNPHMEEADYIPYDLLDLEEYISPPDIYNFPPDIPIHNPIDMSRINLAKILYPMPPTASA